MNTTDYDRPSSDLPAGLVFALKAVQMGIRTVICTDADHHSDRICSLLDLLYSSEHKVVAYVEARTCNLGAFYDKEHDEIIFCKFDEREGKPLVKDWKKAMEHSMLFPELWS